MFLSGLHRPPGFRMNSGRNMQVPNKTEMMKRQLKYICMLLVLFSVTATFGQNKPADVRRTPQEQAEFEKSVPLNPAKIAVQDQADARMDPTRAQAPPTNWKPEVTPVDDRKLPGTDAVSTGQVAGQAAPAVDRTQPEGAQPQGKPVDYRGINGPKTQPDGMKPAHETNYRNQEGSRTQPEGERPKR